MKSVAKNVMKVLLFLFLLSLCTYYVSRTLKDKYNYHKYEGFYEEKENFDVLFFGSSRMLNAIFPMELWEDYGLTSYNMAQHSETTGVTYWQLKNALQYNTPKIAVVDISLLRRETVTAENEEAKGALHKSLDHMPLSKLKYEALQDLTVEIDPWEYLFPLTIYHNRWNDLIREDFYLPSTARKGAEPRVAITPLDPCSWSSQDSSPALDTLGTRIDDIVALCREENVELIFTCMPSPWISSLVGACADMNAFTAYAEQLEIPFLNFAKDNHFLNYATDFYDSSHVNPSGAKKLTKTLGEYLAEHYVFTEKKEHTLKNWEDALAEYKKMKIDELVREKMEGDLNSYLILLNDDDYLFKISAPDKNCVGKDLSLPVLQELGITEQDISFDNTLSSIQITVYDSAEETLKEYAEFPVS